MFSCDFCEIWQNTFFTEHLWTTASENGEYQKIRIDVLKQVLKRQLIIKEISLSEFVQFLAYSIWLQKPKTFSLFKVQSQSCSCCKYLSCLPSKNKFSIFLKIMFVFLKVFISQHEKFGFNVFLWRLSLKLKVVSVLPI